MNDDLIWYIDLLMTEDDLNYYYEHMHEQIQQWFEKVGIAKGQWELGIRMDPLIFEEEGYARYIYSFAKEKYANWFDVKWNNFERKANGTLD